VFWLFPRFLFAHGIAVRLFVNHWGLDGSLSISCVVLDCIFVNTFGAVLFCRQETWLNQQENAGEDG